MASWVSARQTLRRRSRTRWRCCGSPRSAPPRLFWNTREAWVSRTSTAGGWCGLEAGISHRRSDAIGVRSRPRPARGRHGRRRYAPGLARAIRSRSRSNCRVRSGWRCGRVGVQSWTQCTLRPPPRRPRRRLPRCRSAQRRWHAFGPSCPRTASRTCAGARCGRARCSADRSVWSVNSAASGGGVAELLRTLLPYWRGCRANARSAVVRGTPPFFRVTKRLHNWLHGSRAMAATSGRRGVGALRSRQRFARGRAGPPGGTRRRRPAPGSTDRAARGTAEGVRARR